MRITSGWWVAPALLCTTGAASAQAPAAMLSPRPRSRLSGSCVPPTNQATG